MNDRKPLDRGACARCGQPFSMTRPNRRYCSQHCGEVAAAERGLARYAAKLEALVGPRWIAFTPTPEQSAQGERSHKGLRTEIGLQFREGIPLGAILDNLADLAAEIIDSRVGPAAILPWFDAQKARLQPIVDELDDGKETP